MTVEQALKFLECLRAKQAYLAPNGWIRSTCPLAKWTHAHHTDNSPSFGMILGDGKAHFYCFACRKGSAALLLQTMEMYVTKEYWGQYDFKTAHEILNQEEINIAPLGEYQEFKQGSQTFKEWPAYWLDSFKPIEYFPDAIAYLQNRNVSAETIQKFKLRYDSAREMIVCPYWTVFGQFAGARGRSIHSHTEGLGKHYDYRFQGVNNARFVWYNEQALELPGPAVVVEGQFDVFRTALGWPKTLGNLTAKPTYEKMLKIADASTVVLIPDPDQAGAESKKVYQDFCNQLHVDLRIVDIPQNGAEKIDPDKCHPAWLRESIEAALY